MKIRLTKKNQTQPKTLINRKTHELKHFLLLTVIFLGFSMADANAQDLKVSISQQNIAIKDVLQRIEKQTTYLFVYNRAEIDLDQKVNVNVSDVSVKNVLADILKDQNLTFYQEGNNIVLQKSQQKSETKKQITGVIKDLNGEPLIGASVKTKDSTTGTMTDINGSYSLSVSVGSVIEVAYIGYIGQTATISTKNSYDFILKESDRELEAVVVTALGIKRSEKALSYNVQQIESDAITTNKDANFINALSGKVAGLNINASSSGVGGVSKATMRGTKSITGSSDALYVIDGVPMFSTVVNNGGGKEFDSRGAIDPVADINPEDIESMSVLTGAAAAALYGSTAANGAIIINTKKGKEGRVTVTVNSSMELSEPFVLPRFQSKYGTGSNGILNSSPVYSWGPKLTEAQYFGYHPDDYFKTGILATENVSVSAGSSKNQTYVSAGAVNSKGIVPNNKYDRYNFNFRNTTSFLNDKMTLDVSASYIRQNDRNTTNQGTYNNPIVGAYLYPRGNNWEDAKVYEQINIERKIYEQRWAPGDAGMTMQNPYWINYRNLRENGKDRYMLGGSLSYEILDWLNISGRIKLDNSHYDYTEKFFATTNTQLTESSDRGLYGITKVQDKTLYGDFLISVNKYFGSNNDLSLQANTGGSFTYITYDELKVRGPIADGSEAFDGEVGLTNHFAVQNLSKTKTRSFQDGGREQVQSLYASAELGYKSTYYLTITGRNDWPSQLAGPRSVHTSFFYPSAGLSAVVSELIPSLNKDYLSYAKLRFSYASVGNAFDRYLANPRFRYNSSLGGYDVLTSRPKYDLKPERTNSFEAGINLRFLKNFELDVTYYDAKTEDQLFEIDGGIDFSKMLMQTGALRNRGLEVALSYKNKWGKFSWDTGLTYSMNRNKVLRLAENEYNPETGELININYMPMNALGGTYFLVKVGEDIGDLYSQMDLRRDANGAIYIDENDAVHTQPIQNVDDYIKLGSVSPKANLAWRNGFTLNNLSFGFLISARLGGISFSRTQATLDEFGVSEASAKARDLGYVSVNGNDRVNPESWYTTVGGGTSVPHYYTYSATNVRLQEASIGYNFPRRWLNNVCDIKVSLVGRNLLMIYNKAPFDPQSIASTRSFYDGIDYFMLPSMRSFGFNLSFKF